MPELEKYLQQLTDEGIRHHSRSAAGCPRSSARRWSSTRCARRNGRSPPDSDCRTRTCSCASTPRAKHPHLRGLALRYPKSVEVAAGIAGG